MQDPCEVISEFFRRGSKIHKRKKYSIRTKDLIKKYFLFFRKKVRSKSLNSRREALVSVRLPVYRVKCSFVFFQRRVEWCGLSICVIFAEEGRIMERKAFVIGTGSYLPEKILTNSDLEKMVDTSDEWIVTRTGMKERRIAAEGEYTSDMGYKAALAAMTDAGVRPEEIDFIFVATLTPDYVFPGTACLLQSRLGAEKAAALDIQAACTGYLYALSLAKSLVESSACNTILIVASEKLSSIVDYTDRNTCVLFGDGASACIVSSRSGKKNLQIRKVCLGADGNLGEVLILPGGGSKNPASRKTVEERLHYIRMEGKEVFKHAVRRMENASKECMDALGLEEKDIGRIVPHQANVRIIEAIAKRFNVSMEKVYMTIHKYGNTSASSIGIALDELLREDVIGSGENILLTAFGAGLTWGAAILTAEEGYER